MPRDTYSPLGTSTTDEPLVSPITPFSMSDKRNVHAFVSENHRQHDYDTHGHEMNTYPVAQNKSHSQMKLINHDADRIIGRDRHSGMLGTRRTIALSLFLLLLPLILSAILVYLIYANLELPNGDELDRLSITENGRQRLLTNDEYYVNFSATRLVFISSLSSTLALALVPIAMTLFSFVTASTWQFNSFGDISSLPTPYQFKVSLELIQGGMLGFYSYIKYLCGHKKVVVSGIVHQAGIMLGLTLLLAFAVTLVDALLHIDMGTVTYNRNAQYEGRDFLPGKNFPTNCWNSSSRFACNIITGGSGASGTFTNTSETYKVMANASTKHFIQLADDGFTSVITTPKSPDGISYAAQSFGSSSQCEMVTSRCEISYDYGGCNACQVHSFNCLSEKSGVLLNGTLSSDDLLLLGRPSAMGLHLYNTSSKDINDTISRPLTAINGQIYSAVSFALNRRDEQNFTTTVANGSLLYDSNLQLFASTYGNLYGVLSCNTTLFDTVYNSTVNGSIHILASTLMNDTASAPFLQTLSFGKTYLEDGLTVAGASATSDRDLAYQFGRTLDRTILGMTSGVLVEKEAASIFQARSKLVAKVPRPAFIALIVLNCVMPVMGLVLAIYDFILIKQHGVAHLQARLGLGGIIAALFEDQRLNADARIVDDLYAEKRSMSTSRIAVQGPGPGQIMFAALPEK